MMSIPRPCVAAVATVAALAVSAPVASASTFPRATWAFNPVPLSLAPNAIAPGACATSKVTQGQGETGGVANQVCTGFGLTFIGPSIGQIATVMGPTIIGPAVIGTLIVSAGNVVAGG